MAEKTVREQLVEALEMMGSAISLDVYRKAAADLGRMELAETAFRQARAALARHRAEPEEHCACEDESCPTWLAGFDAGYDDGRGVQREPAGRGTP